MDHETQFANARLIAAAPELLEALNEAMRMGGSTLNEWMPITTWRKMRAAIDKAEGK